MPTSQTRSVDRNAWMKQSFNDEISTPLALKENPHQTPQDAVLAVGRSLPENNPYSPPGGNSSPINDLPNELLASIFQAGVRSQCEELEGRNGDDELEWEAVDDDNHDEEGNAEEEQQDTAVYSTGYDDILDFQVLVSHVCRSWRSLALSTPDLWTFLSFSKNPRVEKAKEYIIRSKDLPLTINFDSYSSDAGFGSPIQEHIIRSEDTPLTINFDSYSSAGFVQEHIINSEGFPLTINFDSFSPAGFGSLIQEYVIHSEDLPLTINVDRFSSAGFGSQIQEYSQLSQILDLIEPEVSRWRAFTYCRRPKSEIQLLMSRLHGMPEARLLESFRILYSRRYEYRPYPGRSTNIYLPFNGHAPYLKEVVFRGVPIDCDKAPPSFLRGLRKLEVSQLHDGYQPSYATFSNLIKNSTELHTLVLCLGSILPDSDTSLGSDVLTIPSLRELYLQTIKPENITALVGRLNLPNLHTLHLDLWAPGDLYRIIPALSSWSGLLQSISCLTIFGLSCDIASSTKLLMLLVTLKKLRIESFDLSGTEIILETLTMPVATGSNSSDGVFCPNLEELLVSRCNGEKIIPLISARRKAGVPLKKIGIGKSGTLTQDLRWIRKNVEHLVVC